MIQKIVPKRFIKFDLLSSLSHHPLCRSQDDHRFLSMFVVRLHFNTTYLPVQLNSGCHLMLARCSLVAGEDTLYSDFAPYCSFI